MKKYFRVYNKLIHLNLSRLLEYRMGFVNSTISSVAWGIFAILSIYLLTSRTSHVFGWSRNELLVLTGCVNIFLGLFRGLFSGNFETLSVLVKFGRMDSILVKPIDSQFLVSVTYISPASFFRVVLSIAFVSYLLNIMNISVSFFQVILFVFLLIIGQLLLYSIWFVVLTITIWFPDLSNIVGLLYSLDATIRYPQEMYRQLHKFIFFFVLPLTLVVVMPTKVLLQKITINEIVLLLFLALIFFSISRMFWKFALRYYTSASS